MTPKKQRKKTNQIIKKEAVKLLDLLGFKEAKVVLEEREEVVQVNIDSPDAAILIGNRGGTVSSFQLILNLIIFKRLNEWQRLVVNVGDYLEKRKARLERIAYKAAEKVKETGEEITMPNLNSAERRLVHLALKEESSVETESQGQGRARKLVVKPAE